MPLSDRIFFPRFALCMAASLMLLFPAPAWADDGRCPAASLVSLRLPAVRAALAHGRAVTVVALGSSSTQGAGAATPDGAYPARLEAVLRRVWPNAAITVVNRGVGGQDIDGMLARLQDDVLALHPDLVIVQAGANAAMKGMDPAGFAAMLDEAVKRILTTGGDVILMDNQRAPRILGVPGGEVYDEVIAREAQARHVSLFSRGTLMRQWQAADPTSVDMIGLDGVHHTDRGYACIAAAMGDAIIDASLRPVTDVTAARR